VSIATIGVYGCTLESFLAALHVVNVRVVLDVRQRRGVRGPQYAWANSARLQAALASAGIEYEHHKELAPTTDLRHVQYEQDARQGVGKRSRLELAPEYRERYQREILDRVDLGELVRELPADGSRSYRPQTSTLGARARNRAGGNMNPDRDRRVRDAVDLRLLEYVNLDEHDEEAVRLHARLHERGHRSTELLDHRGSQRFARLRGHVPGAARSSAFTRGLEVMLRLGRRSRVRAPAGRRVC
jgi:hypothetical protein